MLPWKSNRSVWQTEVISGHTTFDTDIQCLFDRKLIWKHVIYKAFKVVIINKHRPNNSADRDRSWGFNWQLSTVCNILSEPLCQKVLRSPALVTKNTPLTISWVVFFCSYGVDVSKHWLVDHLRHLERIIWPMTSSSWLLKYLLMAHDWYYMSFYFSSKHRQTTSSHFSIVFHISCLVAYCSHFWQNPHLLFTF